MKKFAIGTLSACGVACGVMAGSSAYAVDDLAEYDVIINESIYERKAPTTGQRDILDYTIFDVGGYYTGGAVDRIFAGTEIGFDVPFNNNRGRRCQCGA